MSGKIFHAPFLTNHHGFELMAVVERHQKNAVNDYPAICSYDSVDDLIADENIELIVINSPNYTHYEYAKKSLLAGKHVLIEKAVTATKAEVEELFELGRKIGKKVMVYQNRRYDSGFKITKSIIESGQLGKLNEVHFRFDRYRSGISPKTFKESTAYAASGLLYDLGPHLLDQAIAIFGKPQNFYKVLANNRENSEVDDYFFIHLSYPNNLNVYLTATLLAAYIPPAFVVNGSRGTFFKNHGDIQEAQLLKGMKPSDENYGIENHEDVGTLCLVTSETDRAYSNPASPQGNYGEIFEAVYQTIANDKAYPISEEEILIQMEILNG